MPDNDKLSRQWPAAGDPVKDDEKAPLVSVIIVNWNGRSLLPSCLSALEAQSYGNFEVIVVDNGSEDDSLDLIAAKFPSVITVKLPSNRGFTGGNIAGYAVARGEYVVLLNNDALLCERWLEQMVAALDSESALGFCASKIVIAGTTLIDTVGDRFTTAFSGTKVGEYEEESDHDRSCLVPGACAAAVIYRRKMLEEIGFLDDAFYFNHEDTDLNMRAWLAGWRCRFVPEAVAYHQVSASIGALSDSAVYYFSRNNEWVWLKNVPFKQMFCRLPHRVLYQLAFFLYFCVLNKKWNPYLRGKVDAVRGAPAMIRKRRAVQALVRLSGEEIDRSLLPLTGYLKMRWQKAVRLRSGGC